MTKTEFYRSIGICPYCRKRKIKGQDKWCIECKQLWDEYRRKRHEEKGEQIKEYQRTLAKKTRNRRIENGECTRCGKKLTDADTDMGYKNYRTCLACRRYCKNHRRLKRNGLLRMEN